MYTANITNKNLSAGNLQIEVTFTDGADTFVEAFNVTTEDDLNEKIAKRIDTLNGLVELNTKIAVGAWVKPTIPAPATPTDVEIAEKELRELKELISLGVMKETDQEFIDAVAAYKSAVAK